MAVGVNQNAEHGMPHWQLKVSQKQSAQLKKIPKDWVLPPAITANVLKLPLELHRNDLMKIPQSCGIMSEREISITQDYTVDQLLAAMESSRLTALEVTVAYSKRAAIAGQLVRVLL